MFLSFWPNKWNILCCQFSQRGWMYGVVRRSDLRGAQRKLLAADRIIAGRRSHPSSDLANVTCRSDAWLPVWRLGVGGLEWIELVAILSTRVASCWTSARDARTSSISCNNSLPSAPAPVMSAASSNLVASRIWPSDIGWCCNTWAFKLECRPLTTKHINVSSSTPGRRRASFCIQAI